MVMLTAAAGYWMAGGSVQSGWGWFNLLMGTFFVAAGTNGLNQVFERDADALMNRTMNRPLPEGRMSVAAASLFSWVMGVTGILYLTFALNPLTGLLAASTLVSYAFLYTPLKKRTSLSTLVGAVPGALPVLGGWAAATGGLPFMSWVLFWILFLWQLPHFLALAWLFREDYERAGFKMMSLHDPDGTRTFLHSAVFSAALFPVSLLPAVMGLAGAWYVLGAVCLSGWLLYLSLATVKNRSRVNALRLFRFSLAYLPVLLILMGAGF